MFLVASAIHLAEANDEKPVSAALATNQARILLVTGMDYPGHLWRQTAPVLAQALSKDPRLRVFTIEDPHFLDSTALARYDAIVMHWKNWEEAGPGPAARENVRRFVQGGKGIMLVHFACGEWHGEWPEFENIAGRAWVGLGPRQHDPYGAFRVELAKTNHALVQGLLDFDTTDELYTCLTGEHPIEVLAQAKSKVDGKYYPMAFVSNYEKGRTFHCTLGHDVKGMSVLAVQELYRRGCAWAAGFSPTIEGAQSANKK